jgi:hypothetical protein
MRSTWIRCRRWCLALSTGRITPGILQGLGLVDFASLITSFLALWLSALVTLLLGGDPTQLFGQTGGGSFM